MATITGYKARKQGWGTSIVALMMGGCLVTGTAAESVTESTGHSSVAGRLATRAKGPLRIMCVGDSITAGYTDNPRWNVPFEFGYRRALYMRLANAGYKVQFVGESPEPWNGSFGKPRNTPSPDLRAIGQDHHRGYGGWGTASILKYIGPWVSADKPDVVLLMIGINDGGSPAARTNLESIVRRIVDTKSNTHVIVAEITPVVHFSQAIADYNAFIRDRIPSAFKTGGKHVRTVNQYTNLFTDGSIDPKLFSNGGNHPTAVAYDRMAQTWFDAIRAICPPPKRTGEKQ